MHPSVSAACLRFICSKRLRMKLGPEAGKFMLLEFGSPLQFFEVSLQSKASWRTTIYAQKVSCGGPDGLAFKLPSQMSMRSTPSDESVAFPEIHDPTHSSNSTISEAYSTNQSMSRSNSDYLLHEQSRHIRMLTLQLTELQSRVEELSANMSPRRHIPIRSKPTHESFSTPQPSSRMTASTVSSAEGPVKARHRSCVEGPDASIIIPRIVYKSDEETDEDLLFS